jgi:hypothetical protein
MRTMWSRGDQGHWQGGNPNRNWQEGRGNGRIAAGITGVPLVLLGAEIACRR